MGCSPSKGKLFSKQDASGAQHEPLEEPSEESNHSGPEEDVNTCLQTTEEENELPPPTEENLASDTIGQKILDTEEAVVNETPETGNEEGQTDKGGKRKGKNNRRLTEKQRKPSLLQKKFDFQPQMVRAHQAAYDLLNSNIPKYETFLELLNQAAQTQLSLQPKMSALVSHFEEITQALEEMAEQGESMLKEHGNNMTMTPVVVFVKHNKDAPNYPDRCPNLLQQLLQQSTEKIRLLAGSVQTLGDTKLEEAVEYLTSLSKLMAKELRAKQEAEQRLTRVLAQIELATVTSFNPEDSALHSEDSGIGGENESLTGSDRHRSDHESAGSGSLGSIVNIHSALFSPPNNEHSLVVQHEYDQEDEKGGDDMEFVDTERDQLGRKRSNSLPPSICQTFLHMQANDTKNRQPADRLPPTAVTRSRPEYSSSECGTRVQLQKSPRILNEQLKIKGNKSLVRPPYEVLKAGLRRHSLGALVDAQKDSRTLQSSACLPMIAPRSPQPKSVRTLINTFSRGVGGTPLPSIRRNKKHVILCLPGTGNSKDGCSVINGNNNNNSWPDVKDDVDVDSLPPPPPEVLLDNSFQSTEGSSNNVKGALEKVDPVSRTNQRPGVTRRLKASMQNVEVLPNRTDFRRNLTMIHSVCQDAVISAQDMEQPGNDHVPDNHCFYQQSYMEHYSEAECVDGSNTEDLSGRRPSPHPATTDQTFESKQGCYGGGTSPCYLPVTAPPVSRVRLPPYCPSTYHSFVNPPVFRPPTTTKPSSRPSSPRTVIRATDNNTETIIPSVSFHNARSVFCLNKPEKQQTTQSAEGSALRRPWEQVSRGRRSTRETDSCCSQSEQRPSQSSHQDVSEEDS